MIVFDLVRLGLNVYIPFFLTVAVPLCFETEELVSQNVIPHKKFLGGHLPYAFTEQGIAMLSTVLKSKRAIQVNIAIMRACVKLREMLASNKGLAKRLDDMEQKYDKQFKVVFDAIRALMTPTDKQKGKIGFK